LGAKVLLFAPLMALGVWITSWALDYGARRASIGAIILCTAIAVGGALLASWSLVALLDGHGARCQETFLGRLTAAIVIPASVALTAFSWTRIPTEDASSVSRAHRLTLAFLSAGLAYLVGFWALGLV
jgi:hydrogenase-4 membrane subunit HyfE